MSALPLDQKEKDMRMLKQRNIVVSDGLSSQVLQMADHPLADRLGVFREMAAAARLDATRATSSGSRLDYERLATSWDELISEIETAMRTSKR